MNELITIQSVRGRIDTNGNPELYLEDVARGLGFTEAKDNKYIRWQRVNNYLKDFGFSTSGENDFIPENIFYKLCFKANNETARKFQDKVTDEVLPSIRKHGAYMTPEKIEEALLNPDIIIKLATTLKSEREKVLQLEETINEQKPKVLFADSVSVSKDTMLIGEFAKILKQNGAEMGQNRLFEWLRNNGYLIKRKGTDYNKPTQYSMELDLFELKETVITHSDGRTSITTTPKISGKGQIYFMNKFLSENTQNVNSHNYNKKGGTA